MKAHHGILFCIVAIMAKQLTLFGKVVPSSVYAQPSTNYEKYFQRNRSLGRSRGNVLKAAQSDWKGVYASVWECIVHCCS